MAEPEPQDVTTDEPGPRAGEPPEERYTRMLAWVDKRIIT